ncbi:MAG: hypothetical protein QNK35_00685 [Bacteroides sp.]|nr:hypothetical protein [Bacteroides sp.]
MGEPSMINTDVLKRNPFPGIRPFTSAEDKLFFGRDGIRSELVDLLQENRFVALVGASASGKTSLIQSGIIPALLTQENQDWVPVSIRPGTKPVENLIRGFQKVFPNKVSEADVKSFLSGSMDLGDLIMEKGLGSHKYCLVVDQFEELFRSGPATSSQSKDPGARRFVDLLVNAVQGERPSIYVLLSIRSDFLEASAAFRTLTELMNRSKFLLPQMSREALATTIAGPVEQAGATLEKGFVEYLLEELEDMENPLPQLQHALMRTWETCSAREEWNKSITINDYQAVGTVKSALSDHLEDLYARLNVKQKLLCEKLFKSITSKSDQYNGFRRQVTLGNIARIAHCSPEELSEVIEVFRQPGRAFLSPPVGTALHSDTIIEISHEALIRIWARLQEWVDAEHESIGMYLKLSHASALYQQGRTDLWKNPDLQLALKWRDNEKPTPAWGVQYNPAFERAMVFLSTSEEELQWEEERKVILQKRRLMINRFIAIFMVLIVLVLGTFFIISRVRPEPVAQEITEPVEVPVREVPRVITPEQSVSEITETDQGEATPEPLPEATSEGAEEQPEPRTPRPSPTVQNERVPKSNPIREPSASATTNTSQAVVEEASPSTVNPPANKNLVSLAQDVAVQSVAIDKNPELQGLLAYQAYRLNSASQGTDYDRDIYLGLYAALKKLISPAYNIYPNLRSAIKDVAWLNRTGSLLAVSSDGSAKILSGNYADRASQIALPGTGLTNECLAVSPDEKKAVVGTNGGGIVFLELENQGEVVHQDTDHGKIVLFLKNLGNSGSFISGGTENRILKWEYSTQSASELVKTSSRLSALSASKDGLKVAFGTRDGKLQEFNVSSPGNVKTIATFGQNQVRAIAYSPGGNNLVVALLDGSLRVLNGSGRTSIATLSGPGARVTDLAYSPDGRFIAAASHDGKVYLWNTSNWSYRPVVFDENNGFVLAVCFSKDSRFFYSGSVDFPRFIGRPTESASMTGEFCSLLSRNLTQEEWRQYFGNEVAYEQTCQGLNNIK